MTIDSIPVGEHLRRWRRQRRLTQLDLAHEAQVSTRHLSCVETGRAVPSREMVLRLSERLAVPLRDRNALLLAAGYAPMYRQRTLDDPALAAARDAIQRLLTGHEPYPALAVDRHYDVVAANRALPLLLEGVAPDLLRLPMNLVRLTLHPAGVAPRIVNLVQLRGHLLDRLRQQGAASADPALAALLDEVQAYALPDGASDAPPEGTLAGELAGVLVPLQLRTRHGVLSFISTVTIFGTPNDVTLQELAIESFFPADDFTARTLRESLPP